MGNRNGSSGSMGYNGSSRVQRPSSASSFRSNSARYRSDRGRSGSSLSNDSYQAYTINKLNSMDDSPLIHKLRQKVASRVMGYGSKTADSGDNVDNSGPSVRDNRKESDSSAFARLKSQSSLTNDQLTAHLTDEERMILQKVFQKEEEFHRESLLKRQTKGINDDHDKRPDGSPLESPSFHDAKRIGDCRTCRKKIIADERYNYCDTCAEPICEDCSSYSDKSEQKLWMCSFCRRRGTQPAVAALTELGLLIPSSLVSGRRRSTIVSVQDRDSSTGQRRPSNVEMSRQSSTDSTGASLLTTGDSRPSSRVSVTGRRLSARPDVPIRRYSATLIKDRYSSADGLDEHIRPASESSNVNIMNNTSSMFGANMIRSRADIGGGIGMGGNSGNNSNNNNNNNNNNSHNGSHRMPRKSFSASDSSLEDFIADSENHDPNFNGLNPKRRRSRRSKSISQNQHHSTSTSGLAGNGGVMASGQPYSRSPRTSTSGKGMMDNDGDTFIESDPNLFPHRLSERKSSNYNISTGYNHDGTVLRHIASDAALYSDALRRKSDSQSSEYSDIRVSSPPGDSMSPSSPDISRSPRESADSDMLGLPSIGALPTQRRSIPSVLVDNAVDGHHLTLKDCFTRRSSTGRALPRIPSEQSRSLLELPQGRTHSTHSLDLPNSSDQPRRASAPEGENITIVIDDVDSAGIRNKNSQIERIILHRDESDTNARTHGFGLCVMGGKMSESDGKLYAYVAYVVPGGPADKMSMRAGDKILEWDRKSLVNCTYEQVCSIIESSKSTAELIIEPYSRGERRGALVHQRRRLSQGFSQSGSDIFTGPPASPSSLATSMSIRRKLPKPPGSGGGSGASGGGIGGDLNIGTMNQGEILIQAWIDMERSELVITILCAKGIQSSKKSSCFVRVRILPELGFECCQTELASGLEWNETVLFQNFPIEKINDMALEIGIWEGMPANAKILGETVIPLESAIAHNTDWWPLLSSVFPYNINRSTSLDTLAVKLHEHPVCLSESKSVPSSRRNSGRSDIIEPPMMPHLRRSGDNLAINISPSRTMSLRHNSIDKISIANTPPPSSAMIVNKLTNLGTDLISANNNNLQVDLPISPRRKSATAIMSRTSVERTGSLKSIDTHRSSSAGLDRDPTDINKRRESDTSSEGLTSESDSINTSTLSHIDGEVSRVEVGDIKLGFVMTKGHLEVEVITARNLGKGQLNQPPDTYVKTYLKENSRHTNKKKTRVVYGSFDPLYKQTLKYDAALIYGRSLLVMVWQKHKGFEHNTPLGAVDVKVNQLNLQKLTISWYKLYAVPKP
ncbi:regulating synaptic membrane exocytosis protein fife isoform X2 [Brevipalpus obovatus]|uniref:regulating synaptic membrane exocytosis protein fife isoform X2 n=1 Tax=Brevipalpus obovatus TaxID=246614 RepID=UPI003D9E59FD